MLLKKTLRTLRSMTNKTKTEGTPWRGDRTYASMVNIRRAFWDQHPQFVHERRLKKTHNDYSDECRMAFHQWKDAIHRAGKMKEKLCQDVTLGF